MNYHTIKFRAELAQFGTADATVNMAMWRRLSDLQDVWGKHPVRRHMKRITDILESHATMLEWEEAASVPTAVRYPK